MSKFQDLRLQALKRTNPYIEEGVSHRPKQTMSPYEKTLERLFRPEKQNILVKPVELKFCKHCSFSIKLSSNGASVQSEEYPIGDHLCCSCSSYVCKSCVKICDRCQQEVCFVCSITLFESSETFTICPDCK